MAILVQATNGHRFELEEGKISVEKDGRVVMPFRYRCSCGTNFRLPETYTAELGILRIPSYVDLMPGYLHHVGVACGLTESQAEVYVSLWTGGHGEKADELHGRFLDMARRLA